MAKSFEGTKVFYIRYCEDREAIFIHSLPIKVLEEMIYASLEIMIIMFREKMKESTDNYAKIFKKVNQDNYKMSDILLFISGACDKDSIMNKDVRRVEEAVTLWLEGDERIWGYDFLPRRIKIGNKKRCEVLQGVGLPWLTYYADSDILYQFGIGIGWQDMWPETQPWDVLCKLNHGKERKAVNRIAPDDEIKGLRKQLAGLKDHKLEKKGGKGVELSGDKMNYMEREPDSLSGKIWERMSA